MIDIKKYELSTTGICAPVVVATWGGIKGNIEDQQDLVEYVESHGGGGGDAVWGSITGNIEDQEDLNALLEAYAMKEWVESQGYLVQSDLSQYATRQWVTGRGYITSDALNGYATEQWVGQQGYITSSALSGYATESWVENKGYIDQIKTVNNQSLIGEGNIEISGLTPEQEDAIDFLMSPEDGVLFTNKMKANHYREIVSVLSTEYPRCVYNVDGDILYFYYGEMYKWDPEKFEWTFVTWVDLQGMQGGVLWKDDSNRLYCGVDYQIDLTSGQSTSVNLLSYRYTTDNNHHSIWKGQYGIYNISGCQKFNETTQTFESYTVNIPAGYDLFDLGAYMAEYCFEYEGMTVCARNGDFFVLTEYEDRLEINLLSEPLFPLEFDGFSFGSNYFVQTRHGLFMIGYSKSLKLVNGDWVDYPIYDDSNNRYTGFRYSGYGIYDGNDFLIGMTSSTSEGRTSLINVSGEDIERTYWTAPSNVAVDLYSTQIIKGYKRFQDVLAESLVLNSQLTFQGTDSRFSLVNNVTQANSIKFTVPGVFTLNDKNIATTDKCILNTEELPYGERTVEVVDEYNVQSNYLYWTTNSGRLFRYTNGVYKEFDGTQWNQVNSISIVMDMPGFFVTHTANDTFYNYGGNTYIWDDANTDWVLVAQNSPETNQWGVWPCGDTLRCGSEYKLVKTGSTYSWEQDALSEYHYGMAYVVNGNIYVLSLQSNYVYQYDETTKTYTQLGTYNMWTDSSFSCFGEIFFPYNSEEIRKIDFSSIDPNDPNKQIDVVTTIPYSSYNNFYGGYDGHVWLYLDWHTFGYCYYIEENPVEVPSTNGSYLLSATRSGDTVTYDFDDDVLDRVSALETNYGDAITITNNILG